VELGRLGERREVAHVAARAAAEVEHPLEVGELAAEQAERALEAHEMRHRGLVERPPGAVGLGGRERRHHALDQVQGRNRLLSLIEPQRHSGAP
jgi:hypothetical protein